MDYNFNSFGTFSYGGTYVAYTDKDGRIFSSTTHQPVGWTNEYVDGLVDTLDNYKNKLVELGVIQKEKTPEEIAKEQEQTLKEAMEVIAQLKKRNEELEANELVRNDSIPAGTEILAELVSTGVSKDDSGSKRNSKK